MRSSRHHLVAEALQHPATLVSLTIAGLALIYLLVLAPEMGGSGLGLAVLVLGVVATVGCFAWRYSVGYGEEEARRELRKSSASAIAAARQREADDRDATRRRWRKASRASASTPGVECSSISPRSSPHSRDRCARTRTRPCRSVTSCPTSSTTPTAWSRASSRRARLLERSEGPRRRRLEYELDDVMDRLEDPDLRQRARARTRRAAKVSRTRRRSPRSTGSARRRATCCSRPRPSTPRCTRRTTISRRCGPGPRR